MNKPEGRTEIRTDIRLLVTVILLAMIIFLFNRYIYKNIQQIAESNSSYIRNSTVQTAGWIEDILDGARGSINNMAQLYSKTLKSDKVNPDDLRAMGDRSVFDYVHFINAEGIDMNSTGDYTDVSDRPYYVKGMQGETGMDGTYNSRVTDEKVIVFYAPIRYKGEIIGVLAGHYMEARMNRILENALFDEPMPSFLCLEDGSVVSSAGIETESDNVLDFMKGHVTKEELEGIRKALAGDEEFGFSYSGSQGETMGYMASLLDNTWTVLQLFPFGAYEKMHVEANESGIELEVHLILLCSLYVAFLLYQEWSRRKNLVKDKLEAEGIIRGINRLFSHFILVNLTENTYTYINGQVPSMKGLSPKGEYTDFITFLRDKFVTGYDGTSMTDILSAEYIRKHFHSGTPFERYEYQIKKDHTEVWESMAVIVLEWKKRKPVSVLLAVQEINGLKQKELQTQDALKRAYESAESANHAKSDFLSRMSHDIRTPMNAIMGMTAIAAMHLEDTTRVKDCLGKITISSQHLLGLINEILDMSKIESGKLELMDEEFDLSDIVDGLLSIFNTQIEAKKQSLSIALKDITHEKVIGDAQRLSQVLVNIMGNAIKFTPEGGSISLQINEVTSRVIGMGCYEFVITDTGIGMEEAFIEKMFEPFSRATDSRTGKIEGTGLGMPIAKSIVSMMNGNIKVTSKKNQGTQMKVTVFLGYVDDAKEEEVTMLAGQRVMVVDDEQDVCENACSILDSIKMPSKWFTDGDEAVEELVRDYKEGPTYAAVILDWKMPKKDGVAITREIRQKVNKDIPIIILSAYDWSVIEKEALEAGVNDFITKPLFKSRLIYVMKKVLTGQEERKEKEILQPQEQFAGRKVLLVDDNELNMEIGVEILTMAGLIVDEATDGKEAVECISRTEPGTYELVLMDIQMPVMNGYEATKAIRQLDREDVKTLPIIAMTADAFSADIRKAEEMGMNGHIAKPIDIDKLMEVLKKWVK